jgi:hypothetical protein
MHTAPTNKVELTYHVVHAAARGDRDGLAVLAVDGLAQVRQPPVHACVRGNQKRTGCEVTITTIGCMNSKTNLPGKMRCMVEMASLIFSSCLPVNGGLGADMMLVVIAWRRKRGYHSNAKLTCTVRTAVARPRTAFCAAQFGHKTTTAGAFTRTGKWRNTRTHLCGARRPRLSAARSGGPAPPGVASAAPRSGPSPSLWQRQDGSKIRLTTTKLTRKCV